jgi:glyoxylase-like metal-dependent hydrolase (beta-lactamase superfamily II)
MPVTMPFVFEPDVEAGRATKVSPLIRRVVAANPSKFTYHGTGTYLVGHGDVAVIDPGPALPAHVEAIVAALEPGERVTHILVTHTHTDHSPATAALQQADRGTEPRVRPARRRPSRRPNRSSRVRRS